MKDLVLKRLPTLLVVDDNIEQTTKIIQNSFRINEISNYLSDVNLLTCESASEVSELAKEHEIDTVIVDLKMPTDNGDLDVREGLDIVSFCVGNLDAAVIVFSAEAHDDAEALSMREGADDYIEKFDGRNRISLRTKYWLDRIFDEKRKKIETYALAGFEFKPGSRDLKAIENPEKTVRLSYSEHDLLQFLFRDENNSISREEYNVWILKREHDTNDRRLDNQIHRLRSKLGDRDAFRAIRGGGYRL